MGYFRSHRIPDYNPFWEEKEHHEDWEEYQFWYHLGHDDGYASGNNYGEYTRDNFDKLTQENEALRNLIDANIRVSKSHQEEES